MYKSALYVNVHHELTPVYVCPVDVLDDTGQYSMDVILDKIATGTDFSIDELIPIYDAFSTVGAGHSAQLRGAIGLRLKKEGRFGLVSDVAIDANESVDINTVSEDEFDVMEIDSDASGPEQEGGGETSAIGRGAQKEQ